ncbi:2,3,4,5-tetrahydropyridine-2,6-dicarboxylate N-succinyltransferase [Haladaptatus sp. F3-133]|mgnify:CR=1 FL=1|jgi:2,3,4,5-tetrahydropyridine-2-carboxylate N-succinyltransferase|uniref:2,3,4,5-tetrahydropyridine-2,6-dicarboxylate N-succinyltransferase n=1 Tax=Halorutilus salinus TaxID=2487751 RepID=A0A9Q4C0S3_9EURY|nr:2,3,4,5-tetrahydropyridine-2,6-dicarboxylate N-succinyltransferase [Halorutilus salinus]MCX2817815.1 2,3,4,5-tetrahydropyridine-2,6-dicarboxylate N-succinyltransferase [Halorutilus salinus]
MALKDEILEAWETGDASGSLLDDFLDGLNEGEIRAAEERDGVWCANEWVKKGVLLNFSQRHSRAVEHGGVTYHDKFELKDTSGFLERGTRNTPDGTVIRDGAYIGDSAIMMSPSFVNIGAYVGDGTLVDSCDTVGSCAQVGDDVKLGANTLVGGVLEPVEDAPVIIEDGVSLGAGCRVTSGFVVGEGCIVGESTLLNPSIPVYDLVEDEVVYGHVPAERRVMQRYVRSSVGDRIDGDVFKPAAVATSLEDDTLEKAQKEDALRA